jgi:hypothetical protein
MSRIARPFLATKSQICTSTFVGHMVLQPMSRIRRPFPFNK